MSYLLQQPGAIYNLDIILTHKKKALDYTKISNPIFLKIRNSTRFKEIAIIRCSHENMIQIRQSKNIPCFINSMISLYFFAHLPNYISWLKGFYTDTVTYFSNVTDRSLFEQTFVMFCIRHIRYIKQNSWYKQIKCLIYTVFDDYNPIYLRENINKC